MVSDQDSISGLRSLAAGIVASLTQSQHLALEVFSEFMVDRDPNAVMVLQGAAGTGKTLMIHIFTEWLSRNRWKVVLLAPTGRAAKVMGKRARKPASTIHRYIYTPIEGSNGIYYDLRENRDPRKTVYIVDEASMLGGAEDVSLMNDLFVFARGLSAGRRLMFVGDAAQLPPVGSLISPALDPKVLREQYQATVHHVRLNDIMRQALDSGILLTAIEVRAHIRDAEKPVICLPHSADVEVPYNGNEAMEQYISLFDAEDPEKVVLVCYSNKVATQANLGIRQRLLETEDWLVPGERIMIVRNNYAWGNRAFPMIANGEMGVVLRPHIETLEERYGLHWMDVIISFQDIDGKPVELDCKVVLDLLREPSAQFSWEKWSSIIRMRRNDPDFDPEQVRDPYIQALHIKYGYAITGHKAQGGQWQHVIVAFEKMYPGVSLQDYMRWAYTALTRASEKLYVLNWPFAEVGA